MKLTKKLILASNSPRRKEILLASGFDFEVIVRPTSEEFDLKMFYEKVPEILAQKKAECFEDFDEDYLILTADTVVVLDNKIINKPENEGEAFEMLASLSDKTHKVVTGVCIKNGNDYKSFIDITQVHFEELTEAEIWFYIKNHHPMDKAGAYGVQDFIGMIGIPKIEGSFYTVMGLPIHLIYKALKPYIILE
ncbi:Maf family nucleotide pyrophosphatase [Lacihabitans soyangensis]|uniref:dTTP/UTP pyrophosphatase n=1 Tax=Lacihabitans soyangensis TaxID=869394 RepID=A0AAE3H6V8_9BACT|nr:Maf family nucleotide pyrophosphatase [Lacihabitans soyangensis]MCP9765858.1 septum formation protein Maf [Lacihabitans soyangensis]